MKQIQHFACLLIGFSIVISVQAQGQPCGDLQITVTPGTTVLPDTEITITASGIFGYEWQPTELFNDPHLSEQTITPMRCHNYYTLRTFYPSSSLVNNGDFSNGNTGFTSDYVDGGPAMAHVSSYYVTTNSHDVYGGFTGYTDHTTGLGNYMVANGARTEGCTVWQQTINVQQNTDYVFSTWIIVLGANNVGEYASIDFMVDSVQLGNWFTPSAVGEWQQFYVTWQSDTQTTATISIINQCFASIGNDFGLDDIAFSPMIACPDTVIEVIVQHTPDTGYVTDSVYYGTEYNKDGFHISAERTKVDTLIVCEKTVQDASDCDSIVCLYLHVISPSTQIILTSSSDFCETGTAVLTVVSELPNYLWSTGETSASIIVTNPGTYSVTASNGSFSSTAYYTISECNLLYLPNSITPSNEDGVNDFFYLNERILSQISDFEIVIYSRWGETVFTSVDKDFKWDGTYNGKLQVGNTFVYVMKYKNNLGQKCVYKGSLLVL